MKHQKELEKINKNIVILSEIASQMLNSETINNIEIDYTLSKTIELYDLLLEIKNNRDSSINASDYKIERAVNEKKSLKIKESEDVGNEEEKELSVAMDWKEEEIDEQLSLDVIAIKDKPKSELPVEPIVQKASQVSTAPTEIRIALNDKFEFVRELFNNNKSDYESFISELKIQTSYQDAEQLVNSKFDLNDEMVAKFLTYIKNAFNHA